MGIIALGTIALDTIKTPYGRRKDILGGSATHFAMAARLFGRVSLVSVVGGDFPTEQLDFLRDKGIGLENVTTLEGRSFRWSGEYNKDYNIAITLKTELGVLPRFRPKVVENSRNNFLFLANLDPDIQSCLLDQMRSAKLVGLDSMDYWIRQKKRSLLKLLSRVDIFFCNDLEARSMTGEYILLKAAAGLNRLGPAIIVIKKGEHGVLLYSNSLLISLPGYPVTRVIDPTGAGDSFAGGFMGYLFRSNSMSGDNLRKALTYGTVIASFNVENFGLERTSRLNFREINKRLSDFKKVVGI